MPQLAQSETARSIKHISLELRRNGLKHSFYTFLINPEELDQTEKARAPVTQTLTSAYIEKYGLGLPDISLQGTTGFHVRNIPGGGQTDGYDRFHTLRNNVYRTFFSDGALGDEYWQMFLYQWEDNEFWEVFPTQFDLKRSKNQPLLYRYTMRFLGLVKLGAPISGVAATGHATKLAKTDAVAVLLQDPKRQAQRAYDGLYTAQQALACEVSARYATLASWQAQWRGTALADYADSLLAQELYNETNYPGTGALAGATDSLMAQESAMLTALKSYLDSTSATIPLLASAAQDLSSACRTLVTKLETLSKKPHSAIRAVQDADLAVGILRSYPDLFKPNL